MKVINNDNYDKNGDGNENIAIIKLIIINFIAAYFFNPNILSALLQRFLIFSDNGSFDLPPFKKHAHIFAGGRACFVIN